ncbi:tetratricopeptide repeat protein [Paludisphaera rhizosphaerae]|uniref:tetratricopeptide repeat protein n=1 Tax=Paludisphaera rhizosphaerae TaxID=2711216 RepID=UPI0013EAFF16|nr:tetratricopeptide repeat protein [Paludisphaera rhizosphaerae]
MPAEQDPQDLSKARTFFEFGNDASQKSNFDYAIDMYKRACKLVPDSLQFRQALRGIQRRRFNNEPSKVGRLVAMTNKPIHMKARSARGKQNYAVCLEVCEEAFTNNPWDVTAAREAAEAAEMMDLFPLAQWYLESVQNEVGKDVEYYRHAAHVHELCEAWPKAISAWEAVKRIDPYNDESERKIKGLFASQTMKKANYEDAIEKAGEKPKETAEDIAAKLEQMKLEKMTPEERLHKEIQKDPKQVWPYIELADIFRKRSQFEHAEKILAAGLKAVAKDPILLQNYAEVQMTRLKRAIEALTKRVDDDPTDVTSKSKLEQLHRMLLDYEIKEFRRRVAISPEDHNLHYQLGLALARDGKYAEAIGEFQIAKGSPNLKVDAMLQAGLSFEADGRGKLAERTYQEALKLIEPGDTTKFNAIHYQLGRVNETLGNMEAAEEHYNEVAANDYTYRDVAQRLKNLN